MSRERTPPKKQYSNKPTTVHDAGVVNAWIRANTGIPDSVGLEILPNNDGTINEINCDYDFTSSEKTAIETQYPELVGKRA